MGRLRLHRAGRASLRQRGVGHLTHLLDTNAASNYLRQKSPRLVARVVAELPNDLTTCTVVQAELRYGIAKVGGPYRQSTRLEVFLVGLTILPFDSAAAKEYARLRHRLERTGALIGPNDLMIASIALSHGLTLVTHNVAEFTRVPGLAVEDWEV